MLISISMVAVGVMGAAMLAMITSARYQRLVFDVSNRAFSAAESGRAYVYARRAIEADYVPTDTFTLATGDQFILSSIDNGTNLVVTVTGVANGGTSRESHQALSFLLALPVPPDDPSGIDLEDVFVLGSELIFRGSTLSGAGGAVIIRGGLTSANVNQGASLAVSTMYFDGDVSLLSGSTSLGSQTDPGALYINGDLILDGGPRDMWGDIYVSGNLSVCNTRIHGNVYVQGNVTFKWGTPTIDAGKFIYYAGTLAWPSYYPQSVLDQAVYQATVPGFEMPDDFQPALRPDAWYPPRGYVASGTLVSGLKIFANNYSSTSWRPTANNVVIVSKGDITITGLGGSDLTGVLVAPFGRVTFGGRNFEGLVLSRDGFTVSSGGTIVTFKNIGDFFATEDDIPVTSN